MRRALLLLLTPLLAAPVEAQVGFSLQMGQPGFYGQLNLGSAYPLPQLIYPQPLVIERSAAYAGQPVYLRVPPGHAKNWGKHCYRYAACDRPVYFVRDDWYQDAYVPRYRILHADRKDVDDAYRIKKGRKGKSYNYW